MKLYDTKKIHEEKIQAQKKVRELNLELVQAMFFMATAKQKI